MGRTGFAQHQSIVVVCFGWQFGPERLRCNNCDFSDPSLVDAIMATYQS